MLNMNKEQIKSLIAKLEENDKTLNALLDKLVIASEERKKIYKELKFFD